MIRQRIEKEQKGKKVSNNADLEDNWDEYESDWLFSLKNIKFLFAFEVYILLISEAVSYTHLDVYKRQDRYTFLSSASLNFVTFVQVRLCNAIHYFFSSLSSLTCISNSFDISDSLLVIASWWDKFLIDKLFIVLFSIFELSCKNWKLLSYLLLLS